MKPYGIKNRSIIVGLLVIVAGVLLYLFNTGILPLTYKHIVFSWQMLLVAIGFSFLFSRHKWFTGVILILVGGFFLLPKLDIEGLELVTQNGWAIILVIVGICILLKAAFHRPFYKNPPFGHHQEHDEKYQRKMGKHEEKNFRKREKRYNESGYIDRNCVFGGTNEKIDCINFKGGEINCVFGGIELDLTDSQLAEGVNYLEVNSVFGGIVLYVPIDWNIEIRQSQVFGNFVDNRPRTSFEINENRTLILNVSSVFGGGEIKCKTE